MMITTTRADRVDSDSSDSYSSDEDFSEVQPWTSIEYQRGEPCILTGNSGYLFYLGGRISKVWKQVGRYLQINETVIENIEIEHEGEDSREKAYQLLLLWTRKHGSKATLHDLINALMYLGRNDIAKAISSSNRKQRDSVGSRRALEVEKKSHARLQKQAIKTLRKAYDFYQERLREVDDVETGLPEENEPQEVKEILQGLDKNVIQRKLDLIQEQLCSVQEKGQKYSEIDQQLRVVASKLSELDKTFDLLDDSQIFECKFNGVCYFRRVKYSRPRSSSESKRIPSRQDKEIDDDVFQESSGQEPRENDESKTAFKVNVTRNTSGRSSLSKLFRLGSKPSRGHSCLYGGQEEHIKRKLSVSIIDTDEQFQLEDFVNKFCPRYRSRRPFIYSHCCMNTGLGRSNELSCRCNYLSPLDESDMVIPGFQSTETILSLVTGSHSSKGFINETGVWI